MQCDNDNPVDDSRRCQVCGGIEHSAPLWRLNEVERDMRYRHYRWIDEFGVAYEHLASVTTPAGPVRLNGPRDKLERYCDRLRQAADADLADLLRNATADLSWPVRNHGIREGLVYEQLLDATAGRIDRAEAVSLIKAALTPARRR